MKLSSHVIKSTIVGALGGLLFGFDTAVISGTTAALTQQFHLSEAALGFTVASALWGTVIGAIFAGIPGQRYGRRDSLRAMAAFYVISAIGCALAWNLSSLIFFRFIGGLGIGGSSVLGPMYIAEIAPAHWRGRLVGFFQVNVVVGILLAYISNYLLGTLSLGAAEWRWQLGIAALPAALFLIALFFIPRSPRWLLTQSRNSEALDILRLTGVEDPTRELEEIVQSLREEGQGGRESLTARKFRLPVFLAITVGMFCQLTGINAVLYYLNDIFTLAGATKVSGNLQAVAVGATNLVATLIAMSVIDRLGRKKLLLTGTVGLVGCLSAIGYMFYTHQHLNLIVWFLMLYIAFFAISHGAVVWVYISEVFPTRMRAKGQSLGSSSHWITNAIISLVFPLLAKSSGAVPFFFFASMMVLDLFLVWFYYPETARISLEKMQHAIGRD
ncbi:sugar porter family MFS transporter [Edaphobacter modestus]|uniref:Sugar porter (SP) family MFS transporter n=1 Tax=Edaphobacter modestus TaxID=388466 RepID=A0A4Q7YUS6_9BACT|nr:sugar porter family MFS transporter [Edaphobacter modestus]RZU41378.1 sugar porter (SP) family MFS transporter [Edaphobacter modestus]